MVVTVQIRLTQDPKTTAIRIASAMLG